MRIIYHPDAATELIEAASFYEAKLPGLGIQFLDEIDSAVAVIAKAPEQCTLVHESIRRLSVKRFPYGIYYRVLPDVIRILVVKHHSRHPDVGMDRT